MTETLTAGRCAPADRERRVADYVGNRMTLEARDAFEDHLVACAACQDEVLLALSVRQALRERREPPRAPVVLRLVSGAALAAAALVAIVVWPAGVSDGDLAGIGRVVEPPAYLGASVRADAPADSALEAAMTLYDQARWNEATVALQAAAALGASRDVAAFFLGASALMTGNARLADSAFAVVESAGPGPYHAEARFYRAKALVRLRRGAEALRVLRSVPPATAIGAQAAALSDTLRAAGIR